MFQTIWSKDENCLLSPPPKEVNTLLIMLIETHFHVLKQALLVDFSGKHWDQRWAMPSGTPLLHSTPSFSPGPAPRPAFAGGFAAGLDASFSRPVSKMEETLTGGQVLIAGECFVKMYGNDWKCKERCCLIIMSLYLDFRGVTW